LSVVAPTTGAWDGLDFLYPVRVFYEDTDFSGFVYHASYLRFFERGRSEALRSLGVSHVDLLTLVPPAGTVVRRLLVDYRLPCRMDDIVVIRTKFRSAKGARMMISQVMERDSAAVATAELEVALINLDGRPRKLTAELAAKLGPYLQAP
jgi:acyl-CoA thioester hydrolase